MKKVFLTFCGFTAALMFAACGGDSSSNSVDQESDDSSSSVQSDSTDVSSSSATEEYTDPSWPDGARAATLEDLGKYYLVKINDKTFHLSTGIKEGMFSLWAIDTEDNNTSIGVLLVRTDFKNGIVKMNSDNTESPFSLKDSPASQKILKGINTSGKATELSFIVKGDKLMYRVDKGKFVDVEVEKVTSEKALVNSAKDLDKKRISCKAGDTTQVFTFYSGRYTQERVVGKDTIYWTAGYVDTYRGSTFFWPMFNSSGLAYLNVWNIASDLKSFAPFASSFQGFDECSPSDFKYTAVDGSALVGDWAAYDEKAFLDWTLTLKASMDYSLKAAAGRSEEKVGAWDVYGDVLFLKISTMLDYQKRCGNGGCNLAIKGNVSGISEDGFTYNHSEKGSPLMPKEWGLPEYDE